MIKVTRLNGSELVLNCDLIEFVEAAPDTIISLVTGKKIMIKETPDEVIEKVAEYRRHSSGSYISKNAAHLTGDKNG